MTSAIDQTKPTAGTATTSSVRANFTAAYDEINALQRVSVDKVVTTGDYDVQVATFTNAVTLAEGLRITVEVGSLSGGTDNANDTTTPTLAVDGGAAYVIVKPDGTAVSSGDFTTGIYLDLMFDDTANKWVWLNCPKADLSLTGVPKAPTATQGDDSTQIATTAFVAGQGVLQIDETDGDPSATADITKIFSQTASGDLAVIFGDGVTKTSVSSSADSLTVGADMATVGSGHAYIGPLLVQWGTISLTSGSPATFTFSEAFPTAVASVQIQRMSTGRTIGLGVSNSTVPTVTGFTIEGGSNYDTAGPYAVTYIAIGY